MTDRTFDTGSDALNTALDRLQRWREAVPERGGMEVVGEEDIIEVVCDVLDESGRIRDMPEDAAEWRKRWRGCTRGSE